MARQAPVVLGLVVVALAIAGCRYEPSIPGARVRCRSSSDCPPGLGCEVPRAAPEQRLCCRNPGCEGELPGSGRGADGSVPAIEAGSADRGPEVSSPPDVPRATNVALHNPHLSSLAPATFSDDARKIVARDLRLGSGAQVICNATICFRGGIVP